ncbi:MAG: 30S ribosomal protein S1 [Planctomycetes bacterium]|nr:30S ribosomal protein S1 [Planctomycetota bacterium]
MGPSGTPMPPEYELSIRSFDPDTILKGRIVSVVNDEVVVDVGYKSEGILPISEFEDPTAIDPGDFVEVLLESVEDDSGCVVLSKRRADRLRGWERIVTTHKEGDVVRGRVTRKIKGGLLMDIGVPVFLPASQVSIRRSADISEFIGQEIEAKIIKIDESRMNIVVSRRKLIEEERDRQKKQLLSEIAEGQVRRGAVKNLADFGAFVDLGGIDGLLHITDMSWGRVGHPSEVVKVDQEIEVVVLKVDKERERIALGLKQLQPSPWKNVEDRYPVGTRIKGEVTNIMNYGAFVKIEDGLEGLVHISEMSWTKRINHPSEMVTVGDKADVIVLDINKEKKEISLGMKQTETNPWTLVEKKYPEGTIIEGEVRNLTNYGAFVELEEGVDGLLHVSDMSWTRKVGHPSEVVEKGQKVRAIVLQVDQEKKRVALGLRQLTPDPWQDDIPRRFSIGTVIKGKVTKITNFGVFVELASDLEGLLHVSELSSEGQKIESPEEVVKPGQEVEVKVLRVDPTERKIGLTMVGKEGEAPVDTGEDLSKDRKVTAKKKPAEAAPAEAPKPKKKADAPRDLPAAGDNALRTLALGMPGTGPEGSGDEAGG